jgi:dephospho-CoA kinase
VKREEKQPPDVTVVGLLGGVASGKSVVARRFGELGAEVIEGDELGHLVLGEPEVIDLLRNRWGDAVVDPLGQVIRREVAQRVFDDPAELAFLEAVTHPRIGRRIEERIEAIRAECQHSQTPRIVVLDAAVMLKAGWDTYCDTIVFVDASLKTRKNRAIQRGWTRQHFEMREASQVSVQEKRRRSDIVIDNNGCLEQTYEQVQKAWKSLSP